MFKITASAQLCRLDCSRSPPERNLCNRQGFWNVSMLNFGIMGFSDTGKRSSHGCKKKGIQYADNLSAGHSGKTYMVKAYRQKSYEKASKFLILFVNYMHISIHSYLYCAIYNLGTSVFLNPAFNSSLHVHSWEKYIFWILSKLSKRLPCEVFVKACQQNPCAWVNLFAKWRTFTMYLMLWPQDYTVRLCLRLADKVKGGEGGHGKEATSEGEFPLERVSWIRTSCSLFIHDCFQHVDRFMYKYLKLFIIPI